MKKLLLLVAILALFVTTTQGVSAAEKYTPMQSNTTVESLSDEQKNLLERYSIIFIDNNMYTEFNLNEKGEMLSNKSFEELQVEYEVSNYDMLFIKDFINKNNTVVQNPFVNKGRLAVRNFRVYMTYSEAKSYLGTVITSGPIAVTGALAVIGAAVGGPAGAAVCAAAGLYGASYIVDVTKQAMRQKRGVWIGWGGIGIN